MIKSRVKAAADFLERKGAWKGKKPIPAESFTMSVFENSCRTRHCAAGHMALDPYFRNRGFRFERVNKLAPYRSIHYKKDGQLFQNFGAIAEFFGFGRGEVTYFFGAEQLDMMTAADVGARLRSYMKRVGMKRVG